MREKIVISYFKCSSPQGEELYRETKSELERSGIRGFDVEVVLRENDTLAGRDAFMCDDVIIFDASLEGEKLGNQYDALMENKMLSEYVLVVSRTILPFNVVGTWKGGYPRYLRTGTAHYPESLTNPEILSWLMGVLNRLELPNSRKILRSDYYKLSTVGRGMALIDRTSKDYDVKGVSYRQLLQVFVSYCSRYSGYFSGRNPQTDGCTVESLIQFISKTQSVPDNEIGYFPPGKLSRELMTLQRRWEVVSDTFKLIFVCSQFWILDTPDYWESWWTLSERITLSYILSALPKRCPDIYIAKFDQKKGGFQVKAYLNLKEKRQFLPKLSEQALRTIRIYFANSRTNSIGYVRSKGFRKQAVNAAAYFLQGLGKWRDEYAITKPEMKELFLPYLGNRPDSDSFWDDFILECPACKQKIGHIRYSENEFLFPLSAPFYHVVHKEDLQQDGQGMFRYTCPSCGHSFYFRPETYYRWCPMKEESVFKFPDAKLVERKDIYVFESAKGQ